MRRVIGLSNFRMPSSMLRRPAILVQAEDDARIDTAYHEDATVEKEVFDRERYWC